MKPNKLLYISLVAFTCCVLVSVVYKREPLQIAEHLLDFPYSKLETAEEVQRAVDEAVSNRNVIFLVHVGWAFMEQQRSRFAAFKRDFDLKHPGSDLEFRYIDCTPITSGYVPLRNLDGWSELEEDNRTSLLHGYGELVWCKEGRVLHVQRALDFADCDTMIAKTEALDMVSSAK